MVITKHTDPVGIASAEELVDAYKRALDTDPVSSFGGIVGFNRELDGPTAAEIAANSYEAVIAPGFSEAALEILRGKQGLELLSVPASPTEGMRDYGIANLDFKRVGGGLLVEAIDALDIDRGQLQVVTRRHPTLGELTDLLFAWRAVRHVRSNAIVLARNGSTVGIGAAQASRNTSVDIALRRAGARAKLAVMASDAYFPFPDGIQVAANAGITAIIQPGGSIRDEMAIEVADRHHLAMVFTGRPPLPALMSGSMEKLLALEMVRVTEAAAIASARFMGKGMRDEADLAATEAMRRTMDETDIAGTIVIGEGERDEAPMLYIGEQVGRHDGGGQARPGRHRGGPARGHEPRRDRTGRRDHGPRRVRDGRPDERARHLPREARGRAGRRRLRRHHAARGREHEPHRRGAAPQALRHHGDHPRPAAARRSSSPRSGPPAPGSS